MGYKYAVETVFLPVIIVDMKNNTFISYSINDSSVAYELSGLLSKKKLTYYLDCVESGTITSEYTKRKVEECDVYIVIPNSNTHNEYAAAMMDYAVSINKRIAVLATDGKEIPESIATHPTFGSQEELAEGVMKMMETPAETTQADNADTSRSTNISAIDEDEISTPIVDAGALDDDARTPFTVEVPDAALTDTPTERYEHKGTDKEFYDEVERYKGSKRKKVEAPTDTATMSSEETKKKKSNNEPTFWNIVATIALIFCLFINIKSCVDEAGNVIDTSTENIESDKQRAKELTEMGKTLISEGHRQEAAKYLLEAAEMGNVHAMYYVGVCYKNIDNKEYVSANWLYRAARKGVSAGFKELEKMAKKDISIAQVHVGTCYFYGYGTKKNRESAAYWYTQAAKLKNPQGYFNLAKCYEHGEGVKESKEEALKMYQQAEKLGHKQGEKEARRLYDELYSDD